MPGHHLALGGGGGFYLFRMRPRAVDTQNLYGNVDIREVQLAFKSSSQIATMRVQNGQEQP
jgi:hypothetical protein